MVPFYPAHTQKIINKEASCCISHFFFSLSFFFSNNSPSLQSKVRFPSHNGSTQVDLTHGQVGKKFSLCSNHKPFISATKQTATECEAEGILRSVCAGGDGRLLNERAADSSYWAALSVALPFRWWVQKSTVALCITFQIRPLLSPRARVGGWEMWRELHGWHLQDFLHRYFQRLQNHDLI